MKRDLKLFNLLWCGLVASTMFMASCSDDDDKKTSGGGKPYDPSQPIKLETFYPDSGGIAQKVILKGSNFGTDPSQIKVYYNQKPAAIVSSNGDMIYA
ncbi:MAG: IPT/TIG domain-containing protein, partial [Tannerellaceae bacterium]